MREQTRLLWPYILMCTCLKESQAQRSFLRPFGKVAFSRSLLPSLGLADGHVSFRAVLDNGLWDEALEPREGSVRRDPKVRLVL